MRKLCPIFSALMLLFFLFCGVANQDADASPLPQVLRNAPAYSGATPSPHGHYATSRHTKIGKLKPANEGAGTANIQADWLGINDKEQLNGGTKPFRVVLTNISPDTTVNFSSITSDDPADFTVSMDCTTLAPGQSCNTLFSFVATSVCQLLVSNITINDDDPLGPVTFEVDGFGADSGLQVDDLTDAKLTATALAQSLVGQGVTVSNVTVTGPLRAIGNFTSSSNIIGFTNGVVLSTGSVRNVVGPNCSGAIDGENGFPGDTDLDNLLGTGQSTNDAAVLEFDFVPTSAAVSFQYVFSSDEYNEFVFQFNDVFGFFLNGNNIALIPGTMTPVAINNVNGGNPLGTGAVNPQFYMNNDFQFPAAAPTDTEMDGLTAVFTAQGTVKPNTTNHIKLAIADALDFALDSNVFIKAGSFTSSAVTLVPSPVNFGSLAVGQMSEPQTVTLTNVGATAVTITSIEANTNFSETNTCPGTLVTGTGTGSSCAISVTFAPQVAGSLTGTLTVTFTTTGVTGPQTATATLTGTGTGSAPTLTVAPTSLTFAQQALGTTSPAQSVTVTNTGATTVNFTQITASGDFAVVSAGKFCTTDGGLAAGVSCTISVTFTPTVAGIRTGTLTLANTATGSPQSVALTGNGGNSTVIISVPSGGSTTATTTPGGTAFFGLLITGAPGITGTVQLGCLSPSPFITCVVIPSTITLNGGTTEVAFGIQTFCKGVTTTAGFVPGDLGGGIAMTLMALLLSGMVAMFGQKRRVAVVLVMLMIVVAFGVGSCASLPKGQGGVTPAGSYPITLTTTLNGQTQTLTNFLTLVVK
jgi:hypothetical protein